MFDFSSVSSLRRTPVVWKIKTKSCISVRWTDPFISLNPFRIRTVYPELPSSCFAGPLCPDTECKALASPKQINQAGSADCDVERLSQRTSYINSTCGEDFQLLEESLLFHCFESSDQLMYPNNSLSHVHVFPPFQQPHWVKQKKKSRVMVKSCSVQSFSLYAHVRDFSVLTHLHFLLFSTNANHMYRQCSLTMRLCSRRLF